MSMIRINLIAERKAGAPKAAKKAAASSGGGQLNEIQENIVLLGFVVLAAILGFLLYFQVKKELDQVQAEERKLQAEYDKLKIWESKKLDLDIQKELLNEKIQKISDLKDKREGPVQLLEDVYNVVPESVWLTNVYQGYDQRLIQGTENAGARAQGPHTQRLTDDRTIMIEGFAKTSDAITNYANKLFEFDRYTNPDLNRFEEKGDEYAFALFFKIAPRKLPADASETEQ